MPVPTCAGTHGLAFAVPAGQFPLVNRTWPSAPVQRQVPLSAAAAGRERAASIAPRPVAAALERVWRIIVVLLLASSPDPDPGEWRKQAARGRPRRQLHRFVTSFRMGPGRGQARADPRGPLQLALSCT